MKKLISIFVACLIVTGIFAQNNMEVIWQNCYGGTSNEDDASIVETNFGYFILSSTNSSNGQITNYWGGTDIWLTAIDSTGNFLWGRCYGGTSVESATNIISDGQGNYFFGGWTFSNDGDIKSGNHGNYDRWIVKIDHYGNIIWEKCYGGSGRDYGGMLKLLSNGNIMVFSATVSGDGDVPEHYGYLDVWITIIDPENGEILKNKVFGNADQNNIFDIVETRDGGFFFTSKADFATGMIQGQMHGLTDVWAVKTDSNLNIEWQKLYGGSSIDYQGWGLLELEDGYIFLANTISNDGDVSGFHGIVGDESTYDIWVVRINSIGDIIWQKCLGGSDWDFGWEIFQSDDGGFVVFAQTDSDDGDVWDLHTDYNNQNSDIWMVKLSANGNIEWSRCYGGIGGENVSFDAVIKKAEDDYIIAATTYYYLNPSGDVGCNPIGMRDLWLFEIKDCDNYMPSIPFRPTGPDTLCITTDSTATYSIDPAAGAWSYEWQVVPTEAGSISSDSTTATLYWAPGWEGQAQISIRSWNDCGQSDWSEVKTPWAFSCLGIAWNPVPGTRHLHIFPNPTKEDITIRYQIPGTGYQVNVFDLLGQKMEEFNIPYNHSQVSIDVSGYTSGVYIVVLRNETGFTAMGKFMKR